MKASEYRRLIVQGLTPEEIAEQCRAEGYEAGFQDGLAPPPGYEGLRALRTKALDFGGSGGIV